MAQMLGDNLLPESVQSARRRFRNRLQSVRRPIRQTRQDLVPGPDLIGRVETQVMSVRDRIVSRDSLLSRVRDQQGQMNQMNGGSGSGSGGNGNGSNTPAT